MAKERRGGCTEPQHRPTLNGVGDVEDLKAGREKPHVKETAIQRTRKGNGGTADVHVAGVNKVAEQLLPLVPCVLVVGKAQRHNGSQRKECVHAKRRLFETSSADVNKDLAIGIACHTAPRAVVVTSPAQLRVVLLDSLYVQRGVVRFQSRQHRARCQHVSLGREGDWFFVR